MIKNQTAVRLHTLLQTAFAKRGDLFASDACVRLFCGQADGLAGMLVDQYGKLVVATVYPQAMEFSACEILEALEFLCPGRQVLVKHRGLPPATGLGQEAPAEVPSAEVPSAESKLGGFVETSNALFDPTAVLVAHEASDLRFEIHCDVRHDFGIFNDACGARALLRSLARGHSVLNLFAYTCGFGVAAMKGGASGVTNVDPNKDYLSWGKANALLNGVDFKVIPDTAQAYLRRLERRLTAGSAAPFDIIVADPPAFGVGHGAARLLRTFWPDMLGYMARMQPKFILLLCNDKYFQSRKDVWAFFNKHLGDTFLLEEIVHDPSITGAYAAQNHLQQKQQYLQEPGAKDPFYRPPIAVLCRKKGA